MKFETVETKEETYKVACINPLSDNYNQFYAHGKALLGKVKRVFSNNKIEMPGKIFSIRATYLHDGEIVMDVAFAPIRNLIVNNGVKPITRYVKTLKPTVIWTTDKSEAMLLTEDEVKIVMVTAAHQWNSPQTETVEPEELTEKEDNDSSDN